MNPEVGTVIGLSIQKLMSGVGEHGAAFAQGQMGLIASMLTIAAKEYDRGADIRFAENNDMRVLFGALAPTVKDATLRAKLEAAGKSKDDSLRISVLNDNNYALRRLLTALQIHAEDNGAREAEQRIWAVLKAMAARRLVQLGP